MSTAFDFIRSCDFFSICAACLRCGSATTACQCICFASFRRRVGCIVVCSELEPAGSGFIAAGPDFRVRPKAELAKGKNGQRRRILLALQFAREFWDSSKDLKIDDPAKDPRVTAGLYSLYAFELIVIDGAKCEDRSAPDNRISQLLKRPSRYSCVSERAKARP